MVSLQSMSMQGIGPSGKVPPRRIADTGTACCSPRGTRFMVPLTFGPNESSAENPPKANLMWCKATSFSFEKDALEASQAMAGFTRRTARLLLRHIKSAEAWKVRQAAYQPKHYTLLQLPPQTLLLLGVRCPRDMSPSAFAMQP